MDDRAQLRGSSVSADQAITELVAAHGDRIFHLGQRLCDDPTFAEDLVQETFLRAYRSWDRFEGRSAPLTWLYSIASRACYRLQRRRAGQPRKVEPLDHLVSSVQRWRADDGAQDESPLDYTIRREEIERLHASISELPSTFRLPLVLKELEGLTIREIAEVLGLREATVKTRLHRARLSLARDLAKPRPRPAPERGTPHAAARCRDLLLAKLEAMDRGSEYPIDDGRLCSACRVGLDSLDRAHDVCALISTRPMPEAVRRRLLESLGESDNSASSSSL